MKDSISTISESNFRKLGIPTTHEVLEWRHPYRSEIKGKGLINKQFRIGRRRNTLRDHKHKCLDVSGNKKVWLIHYKYGTMPAEACMFFLPTLRTKSREQITKEVEMKYPGSTLDIPWVGCQLHGDITATLTLADGKVIELPWNY